MLVVGTMPLSIGMVDGKSDQAGLLQRGLRVYAGEMYQWPIKCRKDFWIRPVGSALCATQANVKNFCLEEGADLQ